MLISEKPLKTVIAVIIVELIIRCYKLLGHMPNRKKKNLNSIESLSLFLSSI